MQNSSIAARHMLIYVMPGIALLIAGALAAVPGRPTGTGSKPVSPAKIILLFDGYIQTRFEEDRRVP